MNQTTNTAGIDLNKPDTLAALLCCIYDGPEIARAAAMLIEQAMHIEEMQAELARRSTSGSDGTDAAGANGQGAESERCRYCGGDGEHYQGPSKYAKCEPCDGTGMARGHVTSGSELAPDPILDMMCDPPYGAPDLYARLVRFFRAELPLAQQQGKVTEWVDAITSAAQHEAERFGYVRAQQVATCQPLADERVLPTPNVIVHQLGKAERGMQCYVCGRDYPHQHSPEEIIIFRNGVKYAARQQEYARADNQGAAQDEWHDAGGTGAGGGTGADQHHEHRAGKPSDNGRDGREDGGSDGLSDRAEVRAAITLAQQSAASTVSPSIDQQGGAPALIQALETGDERESSRWFDITGGEVSMYTDEGYRVRYLYERAAPSPSTEDDQDAKDVARYRWLRSNPVKPGHLPIDGDMWVVQYRHVTGTIPELRSAGFDTSLDARIDVAMSQAKGAGKDGAA